MKKSISVLAAVAALAAVLAVSASGADAPAAAGGKITVTGNGTVLSAPDTAGWSFGVNVVADSAATALARANAAANKIVAAVRAAGVAQKDIRTEHVSLSPQTDDQGRITDRFVASSSIHAVVRNLAQAGKVVDAAVDAGANTMWGPSFSESSREQFYRQALKAAYENARASAQTLADASGVALGRVLEVHEGGGANPVAMEAAGRASDTAEQRLEPGQSSTYATVTITFATS
jgi:uncharacterized protein